MAYQYVLLVNNAIDAISSLLSDIQGHQPEDLMKLFGLPLNPASSHHPVLCPGFPGRTAFPCRIALFEWPWPLCIHASPYTQATVEVNQRLYKWGA
jgi:hypothetical protein